jgi:hypothetical protein
VNMEGGEGCARVGVGARSRAYYIAAILSLVVVISPEYSAEGRHGHECSRTSLDHAGSPSRSVCCQA